MIELRYNTALQQGIMLFPKDRTNYLGATLTVFPFFAESDSWPTPERLGYRYGQTARKIFVTAHIRYLKTWLKRLKCSVILT